MIRPTDDLRIRDVRPLISPAILLEEIPISERVSNIVADTRVTVAKILKGDDPRIAVIVGPCSIHDTAAALEYAGRLKAVADRYAGHLVILMRAYFEKPRTVVGWKGLINDPDLDESYHINKGLRLARKLLLDINELGIPTASEFLDTQIPQHIADLTSWVTIGARTAESQIHRELASGLSAPVGFKNSTDGSTQIAVDAVLSARSRHWFPSVTKQGVAAIFQTAGNDECHVILRGGSRTGPNYDAEHVEPGLRQARGQGIAGPRAGGLLTRQQSEEPSEAGGGGDVAVRAAGVGLASDLRRDDREPPRRRTTGPRVRPHHRCTARASPTPVCRSSRPSRCSTSWREAQAARS